MEKFGCIFDWDGVIIDSSRHHDESWERLARENNLPLFLGHFKAGFGMKSEKVIPDLLKWTSDPVEIKRLATRKEIIYRQLINEWGITPLPGVQEFLHMLCDHNIPCAVGSSTHRQNIVEALRITGLKACFQALVSAEDVHHGKPAPEVFLLAGKQTGLPPSRCIVFEDALVGIEAGKKAGMKVVAVTTTNPREKLSHANIVVDRLDELTMDALEQILYNNSYDA